MLQSPKRSRTKFRARATALAVSLIGIFTGLGSVESSAAGAAPTETLVLYDTGGAWSSLGETYAIQVANLVGHFNTPVAKPVKNYVAGELAKYAAVIYLGSTYDEPIPTAMLTDIRANHTVPVIWTNLNTWQLERITPGFVEQYGWSPGAFDSTPITSVRYKGTLMTRSPDNAAPQLPPAIWLPDRVTVLAESVQPDGTSKPWAVRSDQLTYIAEMPFAFVNETDRYLIFSDLLFDALAPTTATRHRALVRLEDVAPNYDPQTIRAAADYLFSKKVPFAIGVIPVYTDPKGTYNDGVAERIRLRDRPQLVAALKYAQTKGATLIMHGFTHQYETANNPYDGVSGDDFEFYASHIDTANNVRLDGPVALDSPAWALKRLDDGLAEMKAVGLTKPTTFEFPHYAASAVDYQTVNQRFSARYERSLYFAGTLTNQPPNYSTMAGQFFPYVVKDVYGTKVIPEGLGNIEPEPFNNHPARLPADLLNNSAKQKIVRDNVASFFFHPFLDIAYLKQMVEGMQAQGYTFVAISQV